MGLNSRMSTLWLLNHHRPQLVWGCLQPAVALQRQKSTIVSLPQWLAPQKSNTDLAFLSPARLARNSCDSSVVVAHIYGIAGLRLTSGKGAGGSGSVAAPILAHLVIWR